MKIGQFTWITACMTVVGLAPGLLARSQPTSNMSLTARPRYVFVIRDLTTSYSPYIEAANRKILQIVSTLGPGDRFTLLDIGPNLVPEKNIKVECVMPDIPADLRNPSSNVTEWNSRQASLNAAWADVAGKKEAIHAYLARPIKPLRGGTEIFAALEYAARRMASQRHAEADFVIFSDLIQQRGEQINDAPPARVANFSTVHVQIFFVPWRTAEQWQMKERAWKNWFIEKSAALSFGMYDPSESGLQPSLPPSRVPRVLASPFEGQ
jgi:hypothetical protein